MGSCRLWEMLRDQKEAMVGWDGPVESFSRSEFSSEVLRAYEPGNYQEVNKITHVSMSHSSGFSTVLGRHPGVLTVG